MGIIGKGCKNKIIYRKDGAVSQMQGIQFIYEELGKKEYK